MCVCVCAEQLEIGKGRLDDDEPLTWEELRSMKYTWAVIQETMRIEPTVLGGFRIATEDIEFGGYTFLKGWRVSIASYPPHSFLFNVCKYVYIYIYIFMFIFVYVIN